MLGGEMAGELGRAARRWRCRGRRRIRRGARRRALGRSVARRATFAEGASFLMTFLTAWIPMRGRRARSGADRARARRRRAVSARRRCSSRVHLGARVVATAGSEEKRDVGPRAGADEAYGYDDCPTTKADVILDPVGGELFAGIAEGAQSARDLIAIGYAGGMWRGREPGAGRRPQRRRAGLLPRDG